MTIAAADFRVQFSPAFDSLTDYPDPQITFWINRAYSMLDPNVWADGLDFGVSLYVAHQLAYFKSAAKSGGTGVGAVSSKSVGGVSYSRDVASTTIQGAGSFNATTYGVQFYELALIVGSGGIQISGCEDDAPEPTGVMWQAF